MFKIVGKTRRTHDSVSKTSETFVGSPIGEKEVTGSGYIVVFLSSVVGNKVAEKSDWACNTIKSR